MVQGKTAAEALQGLRWDRGRKSSNEALREALRAL